MSKGDQAPAEGEAPADRVSELVAASRLIADRLGGGGRLLVRGDGRAEADARHIVVEFLHPVIVGRPALPALLGAESATGTDAVVGVAYGGAQLEGRVDVAITDTPTPQAAVQVRLPGPAGAAKHAAVVAYHVLWEMAHAFLSVPRPTERSVGAAASLYPMLGNSDDDRTADVAEDGHARRSVAAKLSAAQATRRRALDANEAALARASEIVAASRSVFAFGNGGSSTDAGDFAHVLGPRGLALSSDVATVTALANDVGFDVVFARPLATLGRPGDAVAGFSTSGTSTNVLAGFARARELGLATIGFAGYDGGAMASSGLDALLVVGSDSVHRIQEAQVALYSEVLDRASSG